MIFKALSLGIAVQVLAASGLAVKRDNGNGTNANGANGLPASVKQQYQAFVQTFNTQTLVEDVFTSEFYATPSNFSESLGPGEVLKSQQVAYGTNLERQFGYQAGLTIWRIMYTSLDLYNRTVPATTFVIAPYEQSNKTVVWTHGTSGITRSCAPSNQRLFWYDFEVLYPLAIMGYNIIGTDYAGQGTDTQFNYVAGVSHASDASYSLIATRKALPHLNLDEWAVVGHSEGGMSAWATAEREAREPSGGYLGGVSIAPSMDPVQINQDAFATNASRQFLQDNGSVFYPVTFLETIRRLFPTLNPSNYLTQTGLDLLELDLSGGCYQAAATFFPAFTIEQVWKSYDWLYTPEAANWTALTKDTGEGKLDKPLLVIQGTADEAVSPATNLATFEKHCKIYNDDSPIQYSEYPGFRHDPVAMASTQEWKAFLEALFAKEKPNNFASCKKVERDSFTGNPGRLINYAAVWVPPANATSSESTSS